MAEPTPDLQQRLVDAIYGPGKRRSDTVEELADALIAISRSALERHSLPGGAEAGKDEYPFGYSLDEMDVEAFSNIREWLTKAVEAAGAVRDAGGIGMGQADIDVELEGARYNITIRPLPLRKHLPSSNVVRLGQADNAAYSTHGVVSPPPSVWMAIDTAPKGDELFLVYAPPDSEFPDGRQMIVRGSILITMRSSGTPNHLQFPATHWAPLLPPPPQRRVNDGRV